MSKIIESRKTTSPSTKPKINAAVAALVGSAALLLLGGWSVASGHSLFADPESVLARAVFSADAVDLAVLALGIAGILGALVALVRPGSKVGAAGTVLAGVEVLGLAVGLQSVSTIALLGYLVAMALPFGAIWLAVQVVRHYRRGRWLVGLVLAAGLTVGLMSGAARPGTLLRLATELASGFAAAGSRLLVVAVVSLAAAGWLLLLAGRLRRTQLVAGAGEWACRHRRALTLVAAAGPLPYALIRASWLTPWPLLAPGSEALAPEIRLWGLLLGGGAAVGSVLTVGLIRPWGVVFPRWMPRLAGRTVPVAAAVVPGGLVAAALTASALPMLASILSPGTGTVFVALPLVDRLLVTLVFPFWIWGPSLAFAVWGYARWRARTGSQTGSQSGDVEVHAGG